MARHKIRIGKRTVVPVLIAVVAIVATAGLRGGTHAPPRRMGIIGGVPVASATLPALAYVRIRWEHRVVQCAGTLVAPNAVLTAAHCIEDPRADKVAVADQIRVLVGSLGGASARHPGFTIRQVFIFGRYQHTEESADVALLIMSTSTTLSPIPLASGDNWPDAPKAEMVGWSASNLSTRAILRSRFSRPEKVVAQTVVQTSQWCEEKVLHFSPRYNLCAIDAPSYRTGGCVGASGGPLVANNTSPPREIGIIIRGSAGCSPHRPTVFVRINAVRRWIMSQLSTVDELDGHGISITGS